MDKPSITSRLFDRTFGLLQRSLDLRTSRHKLLSTNVANSETPNYLPGDIPFQKLLQHSIHNSSLISLKKTHTNHFPTCRNREMEVETSKGAVQIDQEMAKLAENHLKFQAEVQALIKKLEGLKVTIQEGGR